jgi:hypothetical protein
MSPHTHLKYIIYLFKKYGNQNMQIIATTHPSREHTELLQIVAPLPKMFTVGPSKANQQSAVSLIITPIFQRLFNPLHGVSGGWLPGTHSARLLEIDALTFSLVGGEQKK